MLKQTYSHLRISSIIYTKQFSTKGSSVNDPTSLVSRHKIIRLQNYVNKLMIKYELSRVRWI